MCGIAGIISPNSLLVQQQRLQCMADVLQHRGPDGEGFWMDGHIGLAHRRLAIIDLRAVAGQPMSNEDGSVWLTFNGEIYNFRELRADLVDRGHVFRTTSDTEVIVHAYEEYGRECLNRFRGMFAFALWNTRTRTLFLARDRIGKKPLYYYKGHDCFMFGSEIKALLADPAGPREPDPVALDHFLALQYIPAPLTAFRGVRLAGVAMHRRLSKRLEVRNLNVRIAGPTGVPVRQSNTRTAPPPSESRTRLPSALSATASRRHPGSGR